MKKYSLFISFSFILLNLNAQIKNLETVIFNVKGECPIAKNSIEKIGNQKKISSINFNSSNHLATVSYDKNKTSINEIQKKIALAGFDNDEYMAPDEVYNNLPKECKYKRDHKILIINNETKEKISVEQKKNELSPIFDAYFNLKDAFFSGNSTKISNKITAFQNAVSTIDMGKLEHNVHIVWMDILTSIKSTSKKIELEKNIDKQRKLFNSLSDPIYKLAKVSKQDYVIYYQHCPMFYGGANWLSKEESITNPYYGDQMLTCGSTIEKL